jgi:hypothetical protein
MPTMQGIKSQGIPSIPGRHSRKQSLLTNWHSVTRASQHVKDVTKALATAFIKLISTVFTVTKIQRRSPLRPKNGDSAPNSE